MSAVALSVQQPWAWAITDLDKRVENRTRPISYYGEVFLHASAKARDTSDLEGQATVEEMFRARDAKASGRMPLGAIVAVAEITDLICATGISTADRGDRWLEGPWAYVLDNVVKLPTPVPCKGALGFWKVPPEVEAEVRRQLNMAKRKKVKPEAESEVGTATAVAEPPAEQETRPDEQTQEAVEPQEAPQGNEAAGAEAGTANGGEHADVIADAATGQVSATGEAVQPAPAEPLSAEQIQKKLQISADIEALLPELEAAEDQEDSTKAAHKAAVARVDSINARLRNLAKELKAVTDKKPDEPHLFNQPPSAPAEPDEPHLFNQPPSAPAEPAEPKDTDLCVCGHPRSCHHVHDNGNVGPCQDESCLNSAEGCAEFRLRPPEAPAATGHAAMDEVNSEHREVAERYLANCTKKGKGLSPSGLALALFGGKRATKIGKERATKILDAMCRAGLVEQADSDKKEPTYLPATKDEAAE